VLIARCVMSRTVGVGREMAESVSLTFQNEQLIARLEVINLTETFEINLSRCVDLRASWPISFIELRAALVTGSFGG
jgi:hypothetical protein